MNFTLILCLFTLGLNSLLFSYIISMNAINKQSNVIIIIIIIITVIKL
jgi:hypothetical protein